MRNKGFLAPERGKKAKKKTPHNTPSLSLHITHNQNSGVIMQCIRQVMQKPTKHSQSLGTPNAEKLLLCEDYVEVLPLREMNNQTKTNV